MQNQICGWVNLKDELYVNYHNTEWGKAIHDDNAIFELFSLETQASGLSWLTVLKKREGYREVFGGFILEKVAQMNEGDIERIFSSNLVIKSKPKIQAIINNAKLFLQIQKEFESLNNYFWSKVNFQTIINDVEDYKLAKTTNQISDEIYKDLKKRGFKFIGSVTIYSFLQAAGLINDHENSCWCK